ncbi:MAG: hypothetical protein KJZ80_16095 [Hyphomicrobiaceae bacterium]|nr:hypothetical protein [Hyphomicrobiaceae bacterium]
MSSDEFLSVTEALRAASEVLAVKQPPAPAGFSPSPLMSLDPLDMPVTGRGGAAGGARHPAGPAPASPPKLVREALKPVERPAPPIAGHVQAPKPRLVEAPGSEPRTRPSTPSPERPTIYVVKGEIHEAVDRAVSVLSNPALEIYARGDSLVRVVADNTPMQSLEVGKQGENDASQAGTLAIVALSEPALVEALTRHIRFMKWSGNAKDYVPSDCPPEVARMVLARKGYGWTVPRLRAVIGAPTLRRDGTVLSKPGYDSASSLILAGDRLWRQVPDSPSKRDALDALDVLVEPIDELPFVDNSDRAAALALLITSVMRPCLRTAPMFAVTAPAAGTGKSLTIDIAAIMATGRKAAVVTPTPDEAELEKRIGSCLLAGDQIISLDNVAHILSSVQLCQMLTQEALKLRILGESKSVTLPMTSLICATGNNLSIYGDLNRRTIRIRLDAKEERPEEREFKFDACELALRKRAELVAAALTIVRAYLCAGAPKQTTPMGSFEDWSSIVRSGLIWLDMGDCCGDVHASRAKDPEKEELAEIIEALAEITREMSAGHFTARDVAAKADAHPRLRDVLERFIGRGGAFSTRSFGRYLLRYSGTMINGRWIEQVSNHGAYGAVWRVSSEPKEEF